MLTIGHRGQNQRDTRVPREALHVPAFPLSVADALSDRGGQESEFGGFILARFLRPSELDELIDSSNT
jgi:hypothetical protein